MVHDLLYADPHPRVTSAPYTRPVRLHIGESSTTIGDTSLAVGAGQLARDHFRHEPPTGLELENAIAAVEDEIARRPVLHRSLLTSDASITELAEGEDTLSREAVEQAFQRLCGRAPGALGERRVAATLVILRELMHHLEVESIVIDDEG